MKILCLSTYPIDEPMHGGQHRLSNIVSELQSCGHEVVSAGVLGSPNYPPSSFFVDGPSPAVMEKTLENYFAMEDWIISEIFSNDKINFTNLSNKIKINPDIIYIEQPWLFKFAQRFNKEKHRGYAKLIYGSANIEHHLKEQILKIYYPQDHVCESRDKVRECEVHAIANADAVFCVSQSDLAWTANYSNSPPVLAANGVADRRASMADIAAANHITKARKFALYCASAHPPNMEGFFDIFGGGAGCIPPEACLVVAGEAGRSLATDTRLSRTGSLQHQFIDAGLISESVLRGLLATAHVMVLPITAGGGTNLKTAEALWSGCHIVATPTAMRGFEKFSNDCGVKVVGDNSGFLNAVRAAFAQPNLEIGINERDKRRAVLWENTLAQMMNKIDALGGVV